MTDKRLYQLLNDADPQLADLTPVPLTEDERSRLHAVVGPAPQRRKRAPHRRLVAAACAVMLTGGLLFTTPGQDAFATAKNALDGLEYSIAATLGIGQEYLPYAEVAAEAQPIGDAFVKLNGVVVNYDEISIQTLVQLPGATNTDAMVDVADGDFSINGQEIKILGGHGQSGLVDPEKNIWEFTMTYLLDKPLPMDSSMQFSYTVNQVSLQALLPNTEETIYRGHVAFNVQTDGSELAAHTRDVAQNVTVDLNDGQDATITHFLLSPLTPQIRMQAPDTVDGHAVNYEWRGTDDQGRTVVFHTSSKLKGQDYRMLYANPIRDAYGHYGSDVDHQTFTNTANHVTLTLYRQLQPKESGRSDTNPMEAVSAPITISLK